MVRHHTFNVGIMGSNPIASTTKSICKPRMNQPGQWRIQGAQMVATLAKGVDFQRGKTGLLNEFQDGNSKKNGLRHLHSVAEN